MKRTESRHQGDLFGRAGTGQPDLFASGADCAPDPPAWTLFDEASRARKRAWLEGELARVRAATAFPWPDLTEAMLAEMHFNSQARLLPPEQCHPLRVAFAVEVMRHYDARGEPWMPLIYSVPDA